MRDKIFALSGLVGPQENLDLTSDYKLSPCKVSCRAIRARVEDTKRAAAIMRGLTNKRPWSYNGLIKGHWRLRDQIPRGSCVMVSLIPLDYCVLLCRVKQMPSPLIVLTVSQRLGPQTTVTRYHSKNNSNK
jgi:hypothetical protein